MSDQNELLLNVENVSLAFDQGKGAKVQALNQVSFQVKKGEIFGLVGESGSGKSTMGRAITRLVLPQSGHIWLGQKDLTLPMNTQMRKELAKEVQMIFQDPMSALNPKWSVMQMLMEPLNIHQNHLSKSQKQEILFAMLQQVGLNPTYANRYVHEFSGGQRQRISIARALINRPKLLICDESIAALDLSIQAQIVNLLKTLRKEFDLSMIFISHDLAMVHYIADRIGVIYKGNMVEQGSADEVYHQPKDPYTISLLNATPRVQFR
jgi:oligopeptide transport system ATP-binding protein